MLYESIEHADITVVRFENKVCFGKLKVMLGELPDSKEAARALKKCYVSCFSLHLFRALKPLAACFTTEQSTVKASLFVYQYVIPRCLS